jgi:hypothetical protein
MASLLVPIAEKDDEDSLSSLEENNLIETLTGNSVTLDVLETQLWEHLHSSSVGRTSLCKLAQHLDITQQDLVERLLPEILRKNPSLLTVVKDEILTKDCLDQLTAQAFTELEQQGQGRISLSQVAEQVYHLPEDAVSSILASRMIPNVKIVKVDSNNNISDDTNDDGPKVLVTKEYLDSYDLGVEEDFLSLTEPAPVETIAADAVSNIHEVGFTTTSLQAGDNLDDDSALSPGGHQSHQIIETKPMATQNIMESEKFVLLRGPSLIAAVLFLSALPHLRSLSILAIARAFILLVGCSLFLHDAKLILLDQFRYLVRKALDNFVLDDFLRGIFDPETGLNATCVGTFVGNSVMYALPLTAEQRVQLVQSALYLKDRQQAATLLQESGGCRTLLPEAARDWLQEDNSKLLRRSAPEVCLDLLPPAARDWVHGRSLTRSILAASGRCKAVLPAAAPEWVQQQEQNQAKALASPNTVRTTLTVDDGDFSTTSSELSDSKVEQQLFAELNLPSTGSRNMEKEETQEPDTAVNSNDEGKKEEGTRPQETETHATPLPLPHEVMGSIMKDIVMQRGKQYLNSLPTGSLEKTGLVAAVFLMIQFRYSHRARQTMWGVLQGSTTLGMSSILAGCIAAVTAKHCYGDRPADEESRSSPLHVVKTSVSTIQELLRRAGVMGHKWKEVLAVLLVAYFGRKSRQTRGA